MRALYHEKLRRARLFTIERFFMDHNSRDPDRIKERLDQIRKAVPATTDAAVITSFSPAILGWAALLKQVLAAIRCVTSRSTNWLSAS